MNQKTAKNENKKRFICGGYLTHKAQPHTFARNRYYASHAPLVDIEIIQKKKKKTSGEEVKKIEQSFRFSPINADTHTQNTHTNHRTQHTHIQRYSNIGYLWLWCINVHSNIYTPMLMEATTGASNSFHIIILIVNLSLSSRPPIRVSVCARARDWVSGVRVRVHVVCMCVSLVSSYLRAHRFRLWTRNYISGQRAMYAEPIEQHTQQVISFSADAEKHRFR